MIAEIDKAYAAGLFDGEGCIMIDKPRRGKGYTLLVTIAQRTPVALIWLQGRWKGGLCQSVRRHKDRDPFLLWYWRLHTQQAARFLADILPYLTIKKEQAELSIEFQSHKKNGRRLTEEVMAIDAAYYNRLSVMR